MEQRYVSKLYMVRNNNIVYKLSDENMSNFMNLCKSKKYKQLEDRFELSLDEVSFDKLHIDILLEYYIDSGWQPKIVHRVESNKIEDHVDNEVEYRYLMRCMDKKVMNKVFECAIYFEMTAAVRLIYLIIASQVLFDSSNLYTLQSVRRKLGISDVFDSVQSNSILKKYPDILLKSYVEESDSESSEFES